MIGQNTVTKLTHHVIVIVGKSPKNYDGNSPDGIPLIYTQKSRPKPNDLAMLKGKFVHLIHGLECTDELYAKWFAEIANTKPSQMVATDSTGEIYSLNEKEIYSICS